MPILLKNITSRLSLILVCTFLLFALQGFSVELNLEGTVISPDGQPLGDVEVMLFPGTGGAGSAALSSMNTRSDGIFSFVVSQGRSYLLEVKGMEGSGRVFVPADHLQGNLKITYPVVENIVLLHTNDQHFDLNHTRELRTAVQQFNQKFHDVFLLNAGDIFVRHPHRWIVNGEPMPGVSWYESRAGEMIDTMNALGYDVLTLGNHELDYIEPYTGNALAKARFPILVANYAFNVPHFPSVKPYISFTTSTRRKLSIIGLSTWSAPKEGIREIGFKNTLEKYLPLRDSADVLVALTHIGLAGDSLLASHYPEFDVIVGGHTHDLLENAREVNSVLIAQAGGCPHFVSDSHTTHLGIIVLSLENGRLKEKRGWVVDPVVFLKEQEEELETPNWR